jgi:hypothetical protein
MLSVITLILIMLSVVMLSVIMLNVTAPICLLRRWYFVLFLSFNRVLRNSKLWNFLTFGLFPLRGKCYKPLFP